MHNPIPVKSKFIATLLLYSSHTRIHSALGAVYSPVIGIIIHYEGIRITSKRLLRSQYNGYRITTIRIHRPQYPKERRLVH